MELTRCTLLSDVIVIMLVFAITTRVVESSKILMIPVRQTSHIMEMNSVAVPLMKRGHQVALLVPDGMALPGKVEKSGVRIFRWKFTSEEKHGIQDLEAEFAEFFEENASTILKSLRNIPKVYRSLRGECHGILGDVALDKKLRAEKFDFVIVDGIFLQRCYYLLPFRMGLPYAGMSALLPADIMATTLTLPAVTSSVFVPFGSTMNFFQRLINLVATNLPSILIDNFIVTKAEFQKYAEGKPFDSLKQLTANSKIWLINQHPMLDFPKPNVPFVIPIGGINAEPSKSLPDKLQAFADRSKDGMIVVSFGGTVQKLPKRIQESLLEAAKQFPNINFLLRNKDFKAAPPSNVMMVDWLPQNDALGHPKTKLFITHCGSGGQHEALYHGVPMLGFPGFADQFKNAARIVDHGYGLKMSIGYYTNDELIEKLKDLFYTDTYRNNIKRAAEIVHNPLNHPNETTIYWIEHVIKYGGDHLKIKTDLYWFQILMWDLGLFLLILFSFIIWIEIKLFRYFWGKCCAKKWRSKPKKKRA